jgi:hypothetical protein
MIQLDKIFLGNAIAEHRKYMTELFRFFKSKGYKKTTIPACGQFTLVKCAIEAGFKPSQIYASDISLFSSILGYLYAGKSIESLPMKDEIRSELKKYRTEEEKAGYLAVIMKNENISA